MKKLSFISIVFSLFCFSSIAQQWVNIQSSVQTEPQIEILHSNYQSITLHFHIDGFTEREVQTSEGTEKIIEMEEATKMLLTGAPDLPKLNTSFIIDDLAEMEFQITYSQYTDYNNYEIAPSKGNLTRDIDPNTIPYHKGKIYSQNEFFPKNIAHLNAPYIARDYRAQSINVYPFQYNPVTKVLRVYHDITVEVSKKSDNGKNPFYRNNTLTKINSEFNELYKNRFINYGNYRYTPLNDNHGKILIICNDSYLSNIQAYAEWKTKIGFPVEIVTISSIGNNQTSIQNYVTNYYNTKGLTYLLLVGDAQHITPKSGGGLGGDSDVAYGYISGNDSYAEIFVGRFSAQSSADVQTQVARTISYEQNPTTTADVFNKSIGISSDQGPGDDNEYDHEHLRNMHTDLIGYNYIYSAELFDGSQGGGDAAGNPTSTMVASQLNLGRGLVLYTGHGSEYSFVSSGFSNTDIANLNNAHILPFVWSVACVNGDFNGKTCFAEAWLRSTDTNGDAIGAVATLMSTINQSWDPPMEAQDEMVDVLVESYSSNIRRTFGGLSYAGTFQMNDTYQDYAMTDTWTIFGDPALMVRTDNPQSMTVSHASSIPIGIGSLQVNCNVNGAFVTLSTDTILGTAIVSGGIATINFTPFTNVDTFTVAVTEYNYIPYLGDVNVIPASGPYITYNSHVVKDPTGNNNSLADYNETIDLDVALKNAGVSIANNVNATLSSTNAYVTITDNTEAYGNIAASATVTRTDAYTFDLANNVPDQENLTFTLNITDQASNSWTSDFSITANAPDLDAANSLDIDDATGNSNGKIDPGETVGIDIDTWNDGQADHASTNGVFASTNPYVTINNGTHSFTSLNTGGGITTANFNITLSASTPVPSVIDFTYTVGSGAYQIVKYYSYVIGEVSEDFETGDFTKFEWQFSGNTPWTIENTTVYAGNYSSVSGNVSNSQQSDMFITLNIVSSDTLSFMKKVSCEQGSTYGQWWDYLEFSIDGTSQDKWDGNIDWSKEEYFISATGQHTFLWSYIKDYTTSSGSDCAWVDDIMFPPATSITTNLFEENGDFLVHAYPNPFNNDFQIRYALANESTFVNIEVYNQMGQVIQAIEEGEKQPGIYHTQISMSDFAAGIYYCRILTENNQKTIKLIKQ
jgi:Peptidase family C25/Propeptide_C25/Peptidase family C25, C terminal ig-like domain/Secretion system C-terminal sorting domain